MHIEPCLLDSSSGYPSIFHAPGAHQPWEIRPVDRAIASAAAVRNPRPMLPRRSLADVVWVIVHAPPVGNDEERINHKVQVQIFEVLLPGWKRRNALHLGLDLEHDLESGMSVIVITFNSIDTVKLDPELTSLEDPARAELK